MNLRIGIDRLKPGWQIVLKQIGVSFEQLDLSKSISTEDYSTIIITEPNDNIEVKNIEEYSLSGGAVLYTDNAGYGKIKYKTKKVSYLCSELNSVFTSVGIIDVFSKIRIPISKQLTNIDKGLNIFANSKRNDVILPFNVNDLILNTRSCRKKFFMNRDELPSEIVAKVSKGNIRKIVKKAMEYLHHNRNLPFVHLYSQPFPSKNLFIFRLDTDFCNQEDAKKMYEVCRKNNISATWFLDTESDESLKYYASMQDLETGAHCHKHIVYNTVEENFNNIKSAYKKLNMHKINAEGFAAPFGDWNLTLDAALQKINISYSSEFALDYDDLPFYPFVKNKFSNILQIPIHPISLGRLIRSHFTEEEMLEYYLNIIKGKSLIDEPVIIYHHPHHQHLSVFEKIFKFVNSNGFKNMSMIEFSKWWKNRYKLEPEFQYETGTLTLKTNSAGVYTKISTKKGYAIIEDGEVRIKNIKLRSHNVHDKKVDLKKIRKFHWRDLLYNYESKRSKRAFQ